MGVDITVLSLEKVNGMRYLEIARHSLHIEQNEGVLEEVQENCDKFQFLEMGVEEEDGFTHVLSKKIREMVYVLVR